MIPAGVASVSVPVVPMNDSLIEGSEVVTLTICPGSGYRAVPALQTAAVSISDDESPAGFTIVTIAAADPAASETAPNPAAFAVTRDAGALRGSPSRPLPDRRACAQRDRLQTLSGSVTIAAGAASANVLVLPINDSSIEPSETVILTLEAS